jgi:lipopolysaccharide/colanic/teichoic acid biosynthesis glycosyltransferase
MSIYTDTKWVDASEIFQVIASILMLFILAPFMILLALLIVIDSKGDIFFCQERIGRNNIKFIIYKFRTFKKNTETLEPSPLGLGDPRLTLVGGYLRKYSLDEIPQLINVIKRDINIVGPRALVMDAINERLNFLINKNPEKKDIYKDQYLNKRQTIRPGITGLAQINGRSSINVESSLDYDMEYVDKRGVFLDLKIIFKTFKLVLTGKGAN